MRHNIGKFSVIFLLSSACSAYAGNENAGTPLTNLIQPEFYGRVDIGNGPPPPVVYAYPILITPPAHPMHLAPLYFHVPPGHAKNWQKHCNRYKACNQPVYFVRSGEYVRDKYYSQNGHEHDFEQYRYDDKDQGNAGRHNDNQKS